MLKKIKQQILSNLKNIPGWHTRKKIVIIECDDWGGIRMPNKAVFDYLLKKGVHINTGRFNTYDTLETEKDLELLFDVLDSIRDKNNSPAVMTPITNMANPDFEKIMNCGFTEYYNEPFTDTLKKYYPNNDVFKLWRQGISSKLFVPELHGREHITVHLWLEKLRQGSKELLIAFDQKFTTVELPDVPKPAIGFRAEFYFTSDEQKPFLVQSIKDSILLFHRIFNYKPRVFVPANGIFHPYFENIIAENGIKFLYVNYIMPYPINGGRLRYRSFYSGMNGPSGLIYYTRNCSFEPCDDNYKGMDMTLRQIDAAFRWGKPANISTHRANFTGGIEPSNRERGLKELKNLLKTIVQKWPDVEFMYSGEALEYMKESNFRTSKTN